jgi:hypothetical protein
VHRVGDEVEAAVGVEHAQGRSGPRGRRQIACAAWRLAELATARGRTG